MAYREYLPISSEDQNTDGGASGEFDRAHDGRLSSMDWPPTWNIVRLILALEMFHAILLATAYIVFYGPSPQTRQSERHPQGCSMLSAAFASYGPPATDTVLDLDSTSSLLQSYTSLHEHTVPHVLSDNNLTFLYNTLSADYYFNLTYLHRHGLVSLPQDADLTTVLDLPATSLPTAPGQSVYKLSVFHHLHCLSRIQRWVISHPPFAPFNVSEFDAVHPLVESQSTQSLEELDAMPRTSHVLHCLDWIRQVIQCDADLRITITNTDPNFLALGGERPRMCRDWNAITHWVDEQQ
jgi:hypothetical protein